MLIFPAIDILDGKAVRLLKGDYNNVTVYNDDPYSVAMDFVKAGCNAIHIVDLDGAREGSAVNMDIVRSIARIPGMLSEIGGGIWTPSAGISMPGYPVSSSVPRLLRTPFSWTTQSPVSVGA